MCVCVCVGGVVSKPQQRGGLGPTWAVVSGKNIYGRYTMYCMEYIWQVHTALHGIFCFVVRLKLS